jgi:hypothetical protein
MESAERYRKPTVPPPKPEQVETERKRDGLLLHRTRVLHDLETCRDDRYRKTLQSGLNFLEQQLAALGWKSPESGRA